MNYNLLYMVVQKEVLQLYFAIASAWGVY